MNEFEFMATVPKGSHVCVSSGSYSDYGVELVGIAKCDITMAPLVREYLDLHPEQHSEYKFVSSGFIHFLVNVKNVIEPVEVFEFNTECIKENMPDSFYKPSDLEWWNK